MFTLDGDRGHSDFLFFPKSVDLGPCRFYLERLNER